MRALDPTESGALGVRGYRIGYEVFGQEDARPVLLLPTWGIVPSLVWRMQVPYLARPFRVITYDPPGIGGSERTTDPAAYQLDRIVDYGIGLLDHLGIERADVIGLSMGGSYGLWMAARYPERVRSLALIGSVDAGWAYGGEETFWARRETYEGWEKRNAHYWREHYDDWLAFFFANVCSEPHSTKGIDDCIGWARETTPDILVASVVNPVLFPEMSEEEALRRVQCPVLLIHGTDDRIADIATSRRWAEARPDWELLELDGSGHCPHLRDPVRLNLELARFLGAPSPRRRQFVRAPERAAPRALFVSSPIGLGHVQRDLAIARKLRRLAPELRIDWLAQHPVSQVLEEAGETIHPMSRLLASESGHWESSANGEHRLHCFAAWRQMDEILAANFMVFLEAVRETPYDLWIGDEAWEVDYHLHENPELKTAPFAFLTDFLGWLPVNGGREAELTADYNAEMIEQVARYPRIRDRALYIGGFKDLVPERFGPGLPFIPDWAREHFQAVGYVLPFDPADYADTRALKARLGHDPDAPLVVCAVGGTAIGRPLLEKAVAAWSHIRRERPEARCLVVAGPRIDPEALPRHEGLEVRGYVHDLYEHLAACDLGIVQGGLSTTMELALTRRPFVSFPLRDHCEQVHNVAYRLERHRAGRPLDFATTRVEDLAEAALETLGTDTSAYRAHETGAAERAAALVAELL